MSRYKNCIVTWGNEEWSLVVSQYNTARATILAAQRVQKRATQSLRHDAACLRHGAARLRHGRPLATIRLVLGHDMVMRARCLGAVRAAFVCSLVHWVCTQPSFGLSVLFQSLFGPLFINTVHKIFQKKSNQIKSNLLKN